MNKEMIRRTLIVLGLCSVTLGINSALHRNNDQYYNADKLKCEEKVKDNKSINELNFEKFMKIASDNKIKMAKDKEEKERKILLEKQKLNERKISVSRGGDIEYDMTFELTFYSSLAMENSKYGAVNCRGIKLYDGMVANNALSYGCKIKLQGWGMVEVLDRGGKSFNSIHRLDVFVPRNDGETDRQYYRRVQKMGRVKVLGKIIK